MIGLLLPFLSCPMAPKKRKMAHTASEPMAKPEISKMLSYIKYHAFGKSKATDDYKAEARRALDIYAQLPASQKKEFLLKFQKGRDLAFVKSFQDTEEDLDETEGGFVDGYYLRSEIFKMNALTDDGSERSNTVMLLKNYF